MTQPTQWALQMPGPDGSWLTLKVVEDPEEALPAMRPGDRLVPVDENPDITKACPRGTVLIGLLFAAVVGFALAMVFIHRGML